MHFETIGSTFLLVFLAELGDKTQLATFGLAAEDRSRLSVFLGAALALVTTSLIAVLLGGFVAKHISGRVVKIGTGILFFAIGAALVLRGIKA